MSLDFVRLECDIDSVIPVQLTVALYAAVRQFETGFKAVCCSTLQQSCAFCTMREGCAYRIIFDQSLSSDPDIVRRHQKPSLPFSSYVRGTDGVTSTGTVGLVIVGSAVNYVEIFHAALLRVIEGVLSANLAPTDYVLRSYSLDYQDVRHVISIASSLSESVILLSGQHVLRNTLHSDSVRLRLKSPLRMLINGSIAHHFDFAAFFCSQLRRCSSLCAYYGTEELVLDFVGLSQAARKVAVLEDEIQYTQPLWSHRLNKAGLTGTAEYTGLIEPMFSLLLLGSFFNAGKGAAFGSGFYQVEVM